MNKKIATLDGGNTNGTAGKPSKQKGEAAVTASPTNDNPAGEHELTDHEEDNSFSAAVDPGTGVRYRLDDKTNIEEITAEEIMAKHAEEAPSEENGFSLDEVVATEQVVPANLAHAGGANFRKPVDKEFIRVTENPAEIRPFDILEVDDKTKYIVTPAAVAAINKLHEAEGKVMIKTKRVLVHLAVNMDGVGLLWPITVTDSDNTWIESANRCAAIAKDQWIRVVSNVPAKRYDYFPANKHAGAVPKWPKETFVEMLNLAFKNKVVKSLDHPAIKQLLDED
jgi:hypothetical protein